MASVSGIFSLTVEPSPGRLKISTTPPIFSMLDLTTSMPTPRPETLVTVLRGRKAGLEDQVQRLAVAQLLRLFGPQKTFLDGLLLYLNDVNPGPVIADFDVDLSAFVISAKRQSSLRRFAGAAFGRRAFRCRGRTNCGPGAPADL